MTYQMFVIGLAFLAIAWASYSLGYDHGTITAMSAFFDIFH